jgi:uncharacterized protein YwqG
MDNLLLEGIESIGLSHWPEIYKSLGKPSIRIKTFPLSEDAPLGVSRFGGDPDLPLSTEWPAFLGRHIPFIAQIRLSETALYANESLLPSSGMLYFFYDIINLPSGYDLEERVWRVIFINTEVNDLHRIPPPEDLIETETQEIARLLACGMSFSSEVTYPRWTDADAVSRFYHEDKGRYEQILHYRVNRAMMASSVPPQLIHRIGGYADPRQPIDMVEDIDMLSRGISPYYGLDEPKTLTIDRNKWVLLLQVDSDNKSSDMFWGDSGRIYFWIEAEKLAARNFDQVHLILQSL